jgi:hypothetical protein
MPGVTWVKYPALASHVVRMGMVRTGTYAGLAGACVRM